MIVTTGMPAPIDQMGDMLFVLMFLSNDSSHRHWLFKITVDFELFFFQFYLIPSSHNLEWKELREV